jgi:hypothetical protein
VITVIISTLVLIITETIIGDIFAAFFVITEVLSARVVIITINVIVDTSDIRETIVNGTGVKIAAVY